MQLLLTATNNKTSFCGAASNLNSTSSPRGITLSAPTLGYTIKNGGQDTLQIGLTHAPESKVIIPLSVSNSAEASILPSSVTITQENWNTPQTITLTGKDNVNYGITNSLKVNYGPSVSADISFHGLSGSSSSILNRDHRKLIFTSALTLGNFGGITGADSLCNSDASKPANTGTYKAYIVQPGVRVASVSPNAGDGQIDWVLKPNQFYTRSDGTPIMTTNSVAIFTTFPLTNSVYTVGDAIWTGFAGSNDWLAAGGCLGWTDSGATGPYSTGNATTFQSLLFGGNVTCSYVPSRLYCVQQ
ncbi:MAG: DUF1554 domain-containing protein [Leptospira sp.]|nr:DUF1554 domain-containing protein [Leptospira sp.]